MITKTVKRFLYALLSMVWVAIALLMITLTMIFGSLFPSCGRYGQPFAEFTVTNVSKEAFFIDSVSAIPMDHVVLIINVVGELDSNATLVMAPYPNKLITAKIHGRPYTYWPSIAEIPLKKGKIKIDNLRADYYGRDTISVKFIPKGCKKGYLNIRTKVS